MQVSIWYVGIIVYIEHFNLLINFEISNKKIFLSLMYFDIFFFLWIYTLIDYHYKIGF